jgi:hypothetical protein
MHKCQSPSDPPSSLFHSCCSPRNLMWLDLICWFLDCTLSCFPIMMIVLPLTAAVCSVRGGRRIGEADATKRDRRGGCGKNRGGRKEGKGRTMVVPNAAFSEDSRFVQMPEWNRPWSKIRSDYCIWCSLNNLRAHSKAQKTNSPNPRWDWNLWRKQSKVTARRSHFRSNILIITRFLSDGSFVQKDTGSPCDDLIGILSFSKLFQPMRIKLWRHEARYQIVNLFRWHPSGLEFAEPDEMPAPRNRPNRKGNFFLSWTQADGFGDKNSS